MRLKEAEQEQVKQNKLDYVASMNAKQKSFILEKARADNNEVIVQLIINSGFDEEAYKDQQEEYVSVGFNNIEDDAEVNISGVNSANQDEFVDM